MRHILLAVAGMTPQIVTETLWWLGCRAELPVAVGALHIATTERARATLEGALTGPDGALARLADDWSIVAPQPVIHVFSGLDGMPLDDIRTAADSAAFATGIAELVRRLTMDPDTALHASLAGGRKTMGFHLGQVMSLFGRPQDSLSHVLAPPAFEECPDFWYPSPTDRILVSLRGRELNAVDAEIELSDIRYVRLRGRLSAHELATAVADPGPLFQRAQSAVDVSSAEAQASLGIDAVLLRAGWNGRQRPLASVLSVLEPDCSLTLRTGGQPDTSPTSFCEIATRAQGATPASARAAVDEVMASLRHALDLERTGYRLVAGRADLVSSESSGWLAHLIPEGRILRNPAVPAIGKVDNTPSLRAVRLAEDYLPVEARSLPIADLAACGVRAEVRWTIETLYLDDEEQALLNDIRRKAALAKKTETGDFRFDNDTLLTTEDYETVRAALDEWTRFPRGFRLKASIAVAAPLPQALIAEIGSVVWAGRTFRVVTGDKPSENSTPILDLADCYFSTMLPPFELPSRRELLAAGLPRAWPPAPSGLPPKGIVIGRSGDRIVRLTDADRARHLYVLGSTGTGKTTLLHNMLLQDIAADRGVLVLDPHGDLIDALLRHVPIGRAEDIMLLDAGDVEHPFGLNFLEIDPAAPELSSGFAVSELLAIFHRLYEQVPEALGPAFEQYFSVVVHLLMTNASWHEPTLLDVARVFSDRSFREDLMSRCRNPLVLDLLATALRAEGEMSWSNVGPYITNKVNRLTLNPLLRNICCQPRSTVDFTAAMNEGKIVLIKLPRGQLAELDVRLLGMLLLGRLFGAAMARSNLSEAERRPFHVYIDEFQNFVTGTVGQMMAEARKYGLRLTLANQNLGQLDEALRETVLANAASLLAFRTGPRDAETLERFLAPMLSTADLLALPNFSCAARVLVNGAPLHPPFVMTTEPTDPPDGPHAEVAALVSYSRETYAHPRAEIEAMLEAARNAAE